jgi:hypothetical protein
MLSPIHQIINLLANSLAALQMPISEEETEKIGIFIFLAMENTQRKFHNSLHVLEVCQNMTPLQTLAGLFHDVVYYQIDGNFPPNSAHFFAPFIDLKADGLYIRQFENGQDTQDKTVFEHCLAIFGFESGHKLEIFGGQNEFLSALLGGLLLKKYITPKIMVAFFACIEATIPFRKPNQQGQTCYDILAIRLQKVAKQANFELTKNEVDTILTQAVELANRDVANFANPDVAKFLDRTWILLPESHAQLWYAGVYSVVSYRTALSKMEGFLTVLQPNVIFDQYNHTPDDLTYTQLQEQATKNLQIACEYIGIKLLPIAIIEAAALLTGGDAPLSFFMGEVQTHENTKRAEHFLPPITTTTDLNTEVYQLLAFGRTAPTSFDLQNSPLSAFVYQQVGATTCRNLLQIAKLFFTQQISPLEFLQQTDKQIVIPILEACAKIATTRRAKLQDLCNNL